MPARTKSAIGDVVRPAKASKKRSASATGDAAPAEEERFASRVALHLREMAEYNGTPWNPDRVEEAFRETVERMPEGALKGKLAANFKQFATMIVDKTLHPSAKDLPQVGEPGGPDHVELNELKIPPRLDFGEMSVEELVEETRRCVLRATFDMPCWLSDDPSERDALEAQREHSLERIADAAMAMVERFKEDAAGSKKSNPRPRGEQSAVIEDVSETLARAQAYAALRRYSGGEDFSREKTHRLAARFPMLRHAFRRALMKEERPARDRRATAGHDAAICCGHTRVFLIGALAENIPDNVGPPGDGDENVEEKKRSKKAVVGNFGVGDLPLFEAALGLAGFDEDFESKITKEGGGTFARLDAPAVDGVEGPALLPPFTPDEALAAADAVAFAPDATLSEIAASYEKALLGGSDWNFNEDSDDEATEAAEKAEAEELVYISAYMSLMKVIRGAAALCIAKANRRRAENLARFAARVPCPAILLMHLPGRAAAADPRAASVELAAASPKLWAQAWRAWGQVKDMLSDAAAGGDGDNTGAPGGFFVDTAGVDVDGAMDLAARLSSAAAGEGLGEGGELSKEEEEDLIEMLRRNKALLGVDEDEDVLDNLSDEEEHLPTAASKVAVAADAAAAPNTRGKTPKKR